MHVFNISGMSKIGTTLLLLCSLALQTAPAQNVGGERGFYFFTTEEKEAIRQSAQMEWGQIILDSLRSVVKERLTHPLEVPMLEGGHGHQYCCPLHNVTFEFNWDKPTSHYCPVCRKDWNDKNVYNWAWVNYVHAKNLTYLNACMYLYLATGENEYAEHIRDMMLDYARKYPTYMVHNAARKPSEAHSGKMFAQSLDESVWATDAARAYDVATPVMTAAEREAIEKGYLRECADLLLRRKDGGNWQAWHNSGLVALGVALHNDSILDVAVNDPKCGHRFLMKKHVYPDGWWNEGSPTYHFYPLRAILLTAEALRCRDINLYDQQLLNMFAGPVLGTYKDLVFPAHNDGWYGENLLAQVKLYEAAYHQYKEPLFLNVLEACYTRTERINPEALVNPIRIRPSASAIQLTSHAFEDVGFALLRSNSNTVVMKYGPYGGGHGHFDKLSVSIHNGKREILSDLGTSAYGVPDYTKWYQKTLAHNTVTVDGRNQQAANGTLIDFKPSKNGGSVAASTNEAYPGVAMKREISLKGNSIHDLFSCTSDTVHTYDYVLLLNDPPQLNSEGTPTELNDSEVYQRIRNVKQYGKAKIFSFRTGSSDVKIQSATPEPFEIFIGEASGIPPTNPGVVTKEGNEKRAVLPCYPVLIRVKSKELKLKMNWNIGED